MITIAALIEMTGVTRRNIQRYSTEGLLPRPIGKSKASRYTEDHVQTLIRIRDLHSAGWTIEEIRSVMAPDSNEGVKRPSALAPIEVEHRYVLARGVRLVIRRDQAGLTAVAEAKLVNTAHQMMNDHVAPRKRPSAN